MIIGVVTFWQSADNFGQILQGYALQRALKAMGNAPVLIRTERDQSSLPFSRKIKLFIHGFFHPVKHPEFLSKIFLIKNSLNSFIPTLT
jgi:hypothetical protein